MKKVNLLSRSEMKNVLGGVAPEEGGEDKVKKYKCCPDGYSQGSAGMQIVCSDCTTGNYCVQGNRVAC